MEALNVLIAARVFAHLWHHQMVQLSQAVVHALQKGQIRDNYLQAVARSVWLLAAPHDIQFEYVRISGRRSERSDALSCMFHFGEVSLDSNQFLNCK